MTEKEIQLLDWVISARESIYRAIETGKVTPLPDALRKLASVAASLTAQPGMKFGDITKPLEYETPEKPKIDKAALDIINEPIADEVPLETPEQPKKFNLAERNRVAREILGITDEVPLEEPKPKRKKVRLDDFDTPLDVKEEAMDRDEKIHYWRAQGYTLVAIAKKVGCSPQTVLNVINRRKQKEQQRLKSEAAYSDPEGGRKK